MTRDSPPPPPKSDSKALVAHAFYAAAIWGLVAYSLWGPRPAAPAATLAAAGHGCLR